MNYKFKNNPRVTIGLPVYNGEKFLHEKLESLLTQTFTDFQIIISDNASIDSTEAICKEYEIKDGRIKYIRQKKNIGSRKNFFFVLQQAKTEYFLWTAVDDSWLPEFLEKTIKVLESNEYVGSISKINYDDSKSRKPRKNRFLKIKRYFSYDEYPKDSSYENRIQFYLRFVTAENIYSVFIY